MTKRNANDSSTDCGVGIEIVNKIPADVLLQYSGKHIALSLDGTKILACGDDYRDLDNKLRDLGIDPQTVLHDYVPLEEENTLLL
jgi:hypothetical protein